MILEVISVLGDKDLRYVFIYIYMQTNSDYATNLQTYKDFTGLGNIYGQIIETWQDLTPKGSWGKEMPLLQWYIGWCSIIIGGRYIISVSFNFFYDWNLRSLLLTTVVGMSSANQIGRWKWENERWPAPKRRCLTPEKGGRNGKAFIHTYVYNICICIYCIYDLYIQYIYIFAHRVHGTGDF